MWWIGLGLVALGIFLHHNHGQQKSKLHALESTDTSTVAHLGSLSQSMFDGLGSYNLNFMTEVCGVVRAEQPLTSELSEQPCVYYDMQVQREFEETYYATDSQGRQQRRTRRSSETVSSNRRSISFVLDDGTGLIEIDPAGAEIIAEKVLSEFQPDTGSGGGRLRLGRFEIQLPGHLGSGRRTLGYRYEERIIPIDREVYVLGEATDSNGELVISRPKNRENRFIVSTKSEAQLVHELESSLKALRYGSIGCIIVGALVFLAALAGL